jgi:hypothetical protein
LRSPVRGRRCILANRSNAETLQFMLKRFEALYKRQLNVHFSAGEEALYNIPRTPQRDMPPGQYLRRRYGLNKRRVGLEHIPCG